MKLIYSTNSLKKNDLNKKEESLMTVNELLQEIAVLSERVKQLEIEQAYRQKEAI